MTCAACIGSLARKCCLQGIHGGDLPNRLADWDRSRRLVRHAAGVPAWAWQPGSWGSLAPEPDGLYFVQR